MKMLQIARDRIAYPSLVKGGNAQSSVSAMEKETDMLQETTRQQEKEEIRSLFRGNGTLYYSDIVERLGIGLRTVVELCDELKTDGVIALDESV